MGERVSIALATYNGAEYLEDQLESYLTQTRQPDELIISDDCSTDNTVTLLQRFADRAPFEVRIHINSANQGYVRNFSNALKHCTGDIVFLSDQDDVWHRDKISHMLDCFAAAPKTQLLIHDVLFCRKDLSSLGQTKIERMAGSYDLHTQYVVGMATAIRQDFLQLCLPIPLADGLTHDLWLHRCAVAIEKKTIVREVLASYRRHGANATSHLLNADVAICRSQLKSGFRATLHNVTSPRVIGSPQPSALARWLRDHGEVLVARGLCSAERLELLIKEDAFRVTSVERRLALLARPRWQRVFPVFRLLSSGGYLCFDGWRSAAKDLLVR